MIHIPFPSRSLRRLAVVLACASTSFAWSASVAHAGGRPRRTVKERDYKQSHEEIVSVDLAAKTVTVATMVQEIPIGKPADAKPAHQEKVVTYKVGSTSEIEVGGRRGDLTSLSKGMKVTATSGTDESTLGRLSAK